MTRIVICGGPRAGKTTLANRLSAELGIRAISTDTYIGVAWENVPDVAIVSLRHAQDWILEGVQAARVLRRWLNTQPDEASSITTVYWLERAVTERSSRQESTAKGARTVFSSIRPTLAAHGIRIIEGLPALELAEALG